MKKFIIIKTTYPKIIQAKKLAKILLDKKLAACVHFSRVESIFQWQNKISQANEIALDIKSAKNCYKKIEAEILRNHPYKTPQIVALEISNGLASYLNWIENNTKNDLNN